MIDLIEVRHKLHQLAEPSGQEKETQKYILEILNQFAPTKVHTFANSYNVIAEYDFGRGTTVLFRADFDAIRVQEDLPIDYKSFTEGVSHKCGHDGHAAILLSLAQKLHENPLPCGKILLFFQAAEETGAGAAQLVQSQFLTCYDAPHVYALHNIPSEKLGTVITKNNSFTCSVVSCDIELHGHTSHAAEPQLANCPYNAAKKIADKILSLSQFDIKHPHYRLVTLIEFRVGEKAYGVTAGHGILRFTLRTQDDKLLKETQAEIENFVKEIASQAQLEQEIRWLEYFAASRNHARAIENIHNAAKELGLAIHEKEIPFSWGEDFGLLTQHYEGALFGLGSGEDTPTLHHPDFDFPDALIAIGSNVFYNIATEETSI